MREVCVIGAGVIGLSSAWYLAQAGYKVTLIDQASNVGTGTSYMNGGQLSYRYVSPLADSGVPLKALKWLFEQDGPLRFKPQADLTQWNWLTNFLLHCRASVNRKTTLRLARLGQYSRFCMQDLIKEHDLANFNYRESGKLVVYRNASTFGRAIAPIKKEDVQQVLDRDECLQQEPAIAALHDQLAGGIYTPSEAVADCYEFCLSLQKKLISHPNFVGLRYATVTHFNRLAGNRLQLATTQGEIDCANFVLTAGIASRRLAATINVDLPLYPLKGYSLNVPFEPTHLVPTTSVTDFEKKVLYARIGNHLRVSAMVDMVGENNEIDTARIASLLRIARRDMPNAGDYEHSQQWTGLRPATPSGSPIVGCSSQPGLWLNVGHGALGFTFACGAASLLASLMTTGHPPQELHGLTWLN